MGEGNGSGWGWGHGLWLASSEFSPSDIPGLDMWFRADAISGLNDGDPVATWADESGGSNDITQATGAKKPTYKINIQNSLPIVRFDGDDDVLGNTNLTIFTGSDTPHSVFAVFKTIDVSTLRTLWGSGTGDNLQIYLMGVDDTPNYIHYRRDNTGDPLITLAGGTPETAAFHYMIFTFSGTLVNVWVDGAQVITNGAADVGTITLTQFRIGSRVYEGDDSLFWKGDIGEAGFYDSEISAGNRGDLETYLAAKWDL